MYEKEAPYLIIAFVLLWIIYNYCNNNFNWNDPAASGIISFMLLLLISALILSNRHGIIVGFLVLTWPFLLKPIGDIIGINLTRNLIPVIILIPAIFIYSILINS
jgi:hypothetical protein